jgi:hypothetical protein
MWQLKNKVNLAMKLGAGGELTIRLEGRIDAPALFLYFGLSQIRKPRASTSSASLSYGLAIKWHNDLQVTEAPKIWNAT